jgi:hypothetical protein
MSGYIKLHRQILSWGWYDDINVKILFLHCLLKANYHDKEWRGIKIPSGSFVTSTEKLSKETGLTRQNVRTCIKKLEKTQELTSKSTNKNTIISVIKWADYQLLEADTNQQTNKQLTNNQPTTNQQLTTTYKEKNIKNIRNKEKDMGRFTPPTLDEVSEYVKEVKADIDPQRFIDFYASKGWMIGKNKMKDWKASVRTWMRKDRGYKKNRTEQKLAYDVSDVIMSDEESLEIEKALKALGG